LGLNSNYCPEQRGFKFLVLLDAVVTVQCSEAAKMWGTAGLCSVLRLAFRG